MSTAIPEVHGAYFRAFDYELWDYWGSASDWGWGPWSVETGWTEGWIAAGLGLGLMGQGTTLWEYTASSSIGPGLLAELCPKFFPEEGGYRERVCGGGV